MAGAAAESAEDYRSTLSDLTGNDKMQINLLTILAEDYAEHSDAITEVIENFLLEVGAWKEIITTVPSINAKYSSARRR